MRSASVMYFCSIAAKRFSKENRGNRPSAPFALVSLGVDWMGGAKGTYGAQASSPCLRNHGKEQIASVDCEVEAFEFSGGFVGIKHINDQHVFRWASSSSVEL